MRQRQSRTIRVDGDAAIRALGWVPRPGQAEMTAELIKAIMSREKIIGFSAPTGSGKSGMALAALRWVRASAAIATPTKQLQQQYMDTLGLPVLYGRAEYRCPLSPTGNAALAPCIAGQQCLYKAAGDCEYFNARARIQSKPVIVINHHLLVVSRIMQDEAVARPVTVVDECHRFVDSVQEMFILSDEEQALAEVTGLSQPAIKERLKTALARDDIHTASMLVKVLRIAICKQLAPGLFPDQKNGRLNIGNLVQSGVLGKRIILVSATMPDIPVDILVEGVPPVPPDKRPLIVIPVAAVNANNQRAIGPMMGGVVAGIITTMDTKAPVIIHTGTTILAKEVTDALNATPLADRVVQAWGKRRKDVTAVRRNPKNQIVVGPALTDGVDLPMAGLQIIVKIPFPNREGGDDDENLRKAARQVVQAYGRLVRSPTSSGTTVVLDANFRMVEPYLPEYVREAIKWEDTQIFRR